MRLTIIAGTNRRGSRTLRVATHVAGRYRALGAEVTLLDLGTLPPELLSPDAYAVKPPAFAPFADAVLAADGLVVVTPEYNGGLPGVLKLFIDMLPFPESFDHKPVCFIGVAAGRWGALRPVEQLQAIWGYRNGFVFPQRVFLPDAASSVDEDGQPVAAQAQRHLDRQCRDFVLFCERLADWPRA